MKFLDLSHSNPSQNVALDEALLDHCEASQQDEILRIWESPDPFVVLGYSNKTKNEVYRDQCKNDGIPILRRPSGGGTVLQGPGCLNYALILRIDGNPNYQSITQANCEIMKRQCNALQKISSDKIAIQGFTDLTLHNLKFSGNAQRRKKVYLLFHGTVLYDFDLALISKYLPLPSKQPDYRKTRSHQDFLINFPSKKESLIKAFREEWGAREELGLPELEERANQLILEKYGQNDWNFKY